MNAALLPFQAEPAPPLAERAPALAAVLGMHAALVTCALHAGVDPQPEPAPIAPIALNVRMIDAPPSLPQHAPTVVTAQPPQLARPAMRHPQPVAPLPVPATDASQPAPAVAAAPLPAAQPNEEVAAAPSVPAPAAAAVAPPRFDADYLDNPSPPYPAMSRRLREAGKVSLLVKVTAQGEPEHIEIREGSGYPRLDEAALNTVQKWRFVPARSGGAAISASVVVPIVFSLDS